MALASEAIKLSVEIQTYILTPIVEETFFRFGLITILLMPLGFGRVKSIAISSVLFGLMHWTVYDPVVFPGLIMVGLFLGFIYITCGFVYSIVLHALINLASSGGLSPITEKLSPYISETASNVLFVTALCLTAYAMSLLVTQIYKFFRSTNS